MSDYCSLVHKTEIIDRNKNMVAFTVILGELNLVLIQTKRSDLSIEVT